MLARPNTCVLLSVTVLRNTIFLTPSPLVVLFIMQKILNNEKAFPCAAQAREPIVSLRTMAVFVNDSKMTAAALDGNPLLFESFSCALNAAHTNDTSLNLELVQCL